MIDRKGVASSRHRVLLLKRLRHRSIFRVILHLKHKDRALRSGGAVVLYTTRMHRESILTELLHTVRRAGFAVPEHTDTVFLRTSQ